MTKFGQVTAYDSATGMATIQYARPDACEKCGVCGVLSAKGSITLQARCREGDWVRIELPDRRFLQAAALVYGIPLLGFLCGLFLGYWLSGSEGGAVAGSLAGLGAGALLLRLGERRIKGRADWAAQVTGVYGEKPTRETIGCAEETD